MKKTTFIIALLLGCVVTSTAQKPSLELTFTAIDSASHIQLDSIKVMNRTQGGDTVLYYPDTILVLDYIVGVEEVDNIEGRLQVFQNYPNPVVDNTTISIFVPEKGLVSCMVTDIMGRVVYQYEEVLESGVHSFSYTPGGGKMSFFTAIWQDSRETIKMLHPSQGDGRNGLLAYTGIQQHCISQTKSLDTNPFTFELGDELLYVGYADTLESGISDIPLASDTNYFQFANKIPCPGTPTVTYDGQVYNTIQILNQCWLKENLNVGVMINSIESQTNNNTIEKYCLENSEDSCDLYGGLYQWNEMMAYVTYEGAKGICPEGWHIPSESEWQILLGSVDTEYGIGDSVWMSFSLYNGDDVGLQLKSANGWANIGNGTDSYGFTALPNGRRSTDGSFGVSPRVYGFMWTSRVFLSNYAYFRQLAEFQDGIHRGGITAEYGIGVRCVKDRDK